jgi:ABC-type transporter Mla MlaB component
MSDRVPSSAAASSMTASSVPILSVSDNRLIVTGCLSVDSVARYQREGIELIDTILAPVVIDLAEAEVQGSAAIALLISWQRHVTYRQGEVSMIGASMTLRLIARACGVDDILAFVEG